MIKIARIALALGLLTSASSLAYASGLVMNDNELRNGPGQDRKSVV